MSYDQIFDYGNSLVGKLGGDSFDIWRPDYSAVDNAPQLIATGQRFRTDPVSGKFAEPRFIGVEYYDIFGPKSLIRPGDILIRTTSDGMTPPVTVITFMPLKAVTGVRSSRRGKIINSSGDATAVYDNIYFDFLGEGYPGSALNRNIEESLRIPNTRVVLFKRDNITRQRMHLVETDFNRTVILPDGSSQPFQRKWSIDEIDFSGNLMVLTIRGV